MRTPQALLALLSLAAALLAPAVSADYYNFEACHVRPLALSPGGAFLFAVNTPDNRLAIFDATGDGLALVAEVPVGLRPVAVTPMTVTRTWDERPPPPQHRHG